MMVLRTYGKMLARLGRELAGVAVVLALVISLAAMPPIQIRIAPTALFDYQFQVDTATWGKSIATYVKLLASGTLGRDANGAAIAPMVAARLGHSLTLMGIALVLALTLGILKGIWDFRQLRRGGLAAGTLLNGAVQGLPDFLLVFLLQYAGVLLFRYLGWRPFPVAWMDEQPIRSMVFPVICLMLIPWAYVARLTGTAMSQIWDEDYIRTAHAKGLPEAVVVYRHAFRNAMILILEGLPNVLLVMISNLLIVEYFFGMPGLSILLKDAVKGAQIFGGSGRGPATDMALLAAGGITLSLVFSLLYMTVTVLRRLADPRVKERGAA